MSKKANAFTIVELLIVIVVIAILAAISIVAYRGIQDRASSSSAQSAARQAATKIQVAYTENETYPASLSSIGVVDSGSTTYQYKLNTSTNAWCVTATTNAKSYYVSSTQSTPAQGGCPGHGQGGQAPITNLIANPSFETGITGWTSNIESGLTMTGSMQTGDAFSGNQYRRLVASNSVASSNNAGVYTQVTGLNSTSAYRAIAYVRSSANISYRIIAQLRNSAGTNFSTLTGPASAATSSVWTRLTLDIPPTANLDRMTFNVYAAPRAWTSGDRVDFDGMMLTEGTVTPTYADGSSPNWDWNGTPNNSTSTGPAL